MDGDVDGAKLRLGGSDGAEVIRLGAAEGAVVMRLGAVEGVGEGSWGSWDPRKEEIILYVSEKAPSTLRLFVASQVSYTLYPQAPKSCPTIWPNPLTTGDPLDPPSVAPKVSPL